MRQFKSFIIAVASSTAFLSVSLPAVACNVCHSKNPKMVKMHKNFTNMSDCFKCHGMQKQRTPEERSTDPLCTGCHKK
ncbi:MAG: hypothetical protein EPN22_06320 [Nitrospirae bacterium]|nr:MAG: hypothetical protein EPN22_06320 [Nitrospirota bacterium]